MKKTVRLLSVVLIIAMMFSMTSSAFAANSFVISGGSSGSSASVSGGTAGASISIGGNPTPVDSTPYGGASVGGTSALDTTSDTQYAKKYAGTGDYSSIENSSDVNVQLNEDFLKCVHDNYDDPTVVSEGTLNFALAFFGEDVVYGTDETAAASTTAAAQNEVTVLLPEEETKETAETTESTPITIGGDTPVVTEAAEETEQTEQAEQIVEAASSENNAAAASGSETAADETVQTEETAASVESAAENTAAEQENAETTSGSETAGETEAAGLAKKNKVIHAAAIANVSSSSTSVNGKTLSSQLNGGKLDMSTPFDICNSTDYKVTIDLKGTSIYYTGTEAAFYIQGKSVTFTDGTIYGDAFCVGSNGILNLGGWLNNSSVTPDITVYADTNAIYVQNGGTAVVAQGTTLCLKETAVPSGSLGVVYVDAGGSLRVTGGYIIGRGTSPAVTNYGYFLLNGSGSDLNSSYANLQNATGIALSCYSGSKTEVYGGTIIGYTGASLNGTSKLYTYNGTITGTGKAATGDTLNGGNNGAAVSISGYAGSAAELNSVPALYAYGGALRAQQTAAIKVYDGDGRITSAQKKTISNVMLSAAKIITQEVGESDYKVATFTVNGVGFDTLADAIVYANGLSEDSTIKLGSDYEMTAADDSTNFNNANGYTITFDGNGHEVTTLSTGAGNGIKATGGKLVVKNVTLNGVNSANAGIYACNGASITVQDEVYLKKFTYAVFSEQYSTVTLNGVYISESCDNGIWAADNGKVTVIMVKDDSDIPVYTISNGSIDIRDGWFKRDVGKGHDTEMAYKVSSYIDAKIANLKYDETNKYYVVSYNDDVTVQISPLTEAYANSDGTAYIVYDKSDANPVIFTVEAKLVKITAVPKDSSKSSYPIYSTGEPGVSGTLRIADNEVLMNCPSGVYDLQFEFANGYIIKDKIDLYVLPRLFTIYLVPNDALNSTTPEKLIKKYAIDETDVDYKLKTYNVADEYNFAVIMSELPDRLAIGSDPNGVNNYYLENYINSGTANASWKQLGSDAGKFAGNYVYFLSYADLHNLAAGQNYAFMVFDDIKESGVGISIPYSFNVVNSNVSISPSEVTWTKASGNLTFTVKPALADGGNVVYIDGEKVDSGYWTYDTSTYKLTINSNYISALDNDTHTVEILTTLGKVGATVITNIGLAPKDVDYHVYGGSKSLTFVASDSILKEKGVYIGSSNPTLLDSSCYVWNSDTSFTLSSAFLNRLSLGTYYVSCYVKDGDEYKYTTTSFKIVSASQASYNPTTGDDSNIFIWAAVLVLSAVAIVVIVLPRLKKQKAVEGVEVESVKYGRHSKK